MERVRCRYQNRSSLNSKKKLPQNSLNRPAQAESSKLTVGGFTLVTHLQFDYDMSNLTREVYRKIMNNHFLVVVLLFIF